MRDLSFLTRDQTCAPALRMQSAVDNQGSSKRGLLMVMDTKLPYGYNYPGEVGSVRPISPSQSLGRLAMIH